MSETKEQLQARIQELRKCAADVREGAKYAERGDYYHEMNTARRLEAEADRLQRDLEAMP